jgi:hypothetical protein
VRKLAAIAPAQAEAAGIANAAWLEDVVMHLLCVLALDRFADYVSDQVPLDFATRTQSAAHGIVYSVCLWLQCYLALLTRCILHSAGQE